ncbi:MAG: biotin/lipoyl-binding protein [Oscillospiraceae bacterium]|jgi:biotin carboxyl carrier protein|nr:biotin/lipoyl-binding protein [Oscillospiraceae bacterium]
MKNYRVTVNGNTYEVGVEEIGGAPEVKSVQAAAPKAAPAPAPKAAPPPKAAPAPKTAPSAGSEDVLAPLPGTVLSVNVAEGAQVKAGDVLLIFEAMKMENEIQSPRDGTVKKIHVAKGAKIETGAPVLTLA